MPLLLQQALQQKVNETIWVKANNEAYAGIMSWELQKQYNGLLAFTSLRGGLSVAFD